MSSEELVQFRTSLSETQTAYDIPWTGGSCDRSHCNAASRSLYTAAVHTPSPHGQGGVWLRRNKERLSSAAATTHVGSKYVPYMILSNELLYDLSGLSCSWKSNSPDVWANQLCTLCVGWCVLGPVWCSSRISNQDGAVVLLFVPTVYRKATKMPLPTDLVSQIEDEQEAIEERMEDLLIFPSEDVLRKSLPLIESHFANETQRCGRAGSLEKALYCRRMSKTKLWALPGQL